MISGDTIAAVATAPGRGGVAVVRVSGPDALAVAERLTGLSLSNVENLSLSNVENRALSNVENRALSNVENRALQTESFKAPKLRVCKFYFPQSSDLKSQISDFNPQLATCNSQLSLIDDGLLLVFRAPRSYTGEDVVEFQCHGGTVTPRRVLEAAIAAGARLAGRGEFTRRAFLNGKLDYDQAASVLDLVDAKTSRAADAALEGLAGRRRRELKALYDFALDLSTRLEHALDVDEGELPASFVSDLGSQISELRSQIAAALRRAHEGKILREGALVVLAGPPNAGKSSLMNALLEENRAIVSDVPGTTRDSIEEWLDLSGWPIRLVDTAGLRETDDEVEGEGVRRSEELVAKADVVVELQGQEVAGLQGCRVAGVAGLQGCRVAGLQGCRVAELRNLTLNTQHITLNCIHVHSKCDLARGEGLNVSAKTGEGLEDLKRAIVAKLEERAAVPVGESVGSADIAALQEALSFLTPLISDSKSQISDSRFQISDFRSQISDSRSQMSDVGFQVSDLVLLANAVRSAAERLGAAIGAIYSSDLLDNLFSRFCVGK